MKYTVILRRGEFLMGLFDDPDAEFYVANPDTDFANVQEAAKAAKLEAADADKGDVFDALRDQGVNPGSINTFSVDKDNYEVVMVFEGQHEPIFGWQPELAKL